MTRPPRSDAESRFICDRGWRTTYWLLCSEGVVVNRTEVRRYWADEGLTALPARIYKKATDRVTAE